MEKKKSRLWIMVGAPGSGKSYWVQSHRKFFSSKMAIISRDDIRFSLLEEGDDYFSKEKEVWKIYVEKAISSLIENDDTILDATHLNESSRGKILRALKDNLDGVEVNAIFINTPLEKIFEQNDMREGRSFVPKSAIHRMYYQMSFPTLAEGFDHIYIYSNNNGKVKYQIIEKEGA